MLTNAKFQHLGFATPDIEATVKFYTEDLGFEVIHRTATPDGLTPIVFIRNGAMTYEVYEDKTLSAEAAKKPDHVATTQRISKRTTKKLLTADIK